MKRYRFFLACLPIMPMNKKRTLDEVKAILEPADEYLSAVTIPILKTIILNDLGMNERFLIMNIPDRRVLLDWFRAAKKALEISTQIKAEVENDNISRIEG